jgi:hypothetical protein
MAYNHSYSCNKPLIPNLNAAKRWMVPSNSFYKEIVFEARQQKIIEKYLDDYPVIGDRDTGTIAF